MHVGHEGMKYMRHENTSWKRHEGHGSTWDTYCRRLHMKLPFRIEIENTAIVAEEGNVNSQHK